MNWDGECSITLNCHGIYEFVGTQKFPGGMLTIKHRLEEKESYESEEALILQYRCSRCGELKSRFNKGYEAFIKQHKQVIMEKEIYHFQT